MRNSCKQVMIVDDDFSIRESMTSVLEMENYQVMEAENGQVALDKLKSTHAQSVPGLILLDLRMPVMDGSTFLTELRKTSPEYSQIPVVVLSANLDFAHHSSLQSAVEKIKKPIDIDRLYDLVKTYCGTP